MEKEKYEMRLYPVEEGKPVIVDGKEYTTSAQKHNVVVNGQKYYIRQFGEGDCEDLISALSSNLELLVGNRKDKKEIILSLIREVE